MSSVVSGWTHSDALTTLEDVPEELLGQEAMMCVIRKVIEVLGDALDKWTESDPPTASQIDLKQKTIDALAKALGPVHLYTGEGRWLKSPDDSFYTCLPLNPPVLALSSKVMEALSASNYLILTEGEIYNLLGSWLYQSSYVGAYDGLHPVGVAKCLALFRAFQRDE